MTGFAVFDPREHVFFEKLERALQIVLLYTCVGFVVQRSPDAAWSVGFGRRYFGQKHPCKLVAKSVRNEWSIALCEKHKRVKFLYLWVCGVAV